MYNYYRTNVPESTGNSVLSVQFSRLSSVDRVSTICAAQFEYATNIVVSSRAITATGPITGRAGNFIYEKIEFDQTKHNIFHCNTNLTFRHSSNRLRDKIRHNIRCNRQINNNRRNRQISHMTKENLYKSMLDF